MNRRSDSWPRLALPASLVILATVAAMLRASADDPAPFDHRVHDGLLPACTGCHPGIATGDPAAAYPSPEQCAGCHDGTRSDPVAWTGPLLRVTNLQFAHADHVDMACADCHPSDEAAKWAAPETCLECHGSGAVHLEEVDGCTVCHPFVTDVEEWSVARLAELPSPPSHEDMAWLHSHGKAAREQSESCAVCHARPSCERCHRNADAIDVVQELAPDPRFESLMQGRPGRYDRPASHDEWDWIPGHGLRARENLASCANCHAQASCRDCHAEGHIASFVSDLPVLREGESPLASGARRQRFHPLDYATAHAVDAAVQGPTCRNCHDEPTCLGCHDAPTTPEFHGPNFLERHGAESYAAVSDCSGCHSVEVYCRECHDSLGLTGRADVLGTFHDAQPLWLLGHGQAARQDLASCVSCHVQRDCRKCHAVGGGWGVNPHGPGFDPSEMAGDNAISCLVCHPQLPDGVLR